jgi:hypothetical protein
MHEKNLSQNSRFPGWDVNPTLSEHEAGYPPTKPRGFFSFPFLLYSFVTNKPIHIQFCGNRIRNLYTSNTSVSHWISIRVTSWQPTFRSLQWDPISASSVSALQTGIIVFHYQEVEVNTGNNIPTSFGTLTVGESIPVATSGNTDIPILVRIIVIQLLFCDWCWRREDCQLLLKETNPSPATSLVVPIFTTSRFRHIVLQIAGN